jgi:hypothetical protein
MLSEAKHLCSLSDAAERKNNCRDSSPDKSGLRMTDQTESKYGER